MLMRLFMLPRCPFICGDWTAEFTRSFRPMWLPASPLYYKRRESGQKNFMVVYGIYKYGIYGSILVYECIYIYE